MFLNSTCAPHFGAIESHNLPSQGPLAWTPKHEASLCALTTGMPATWGHSPFTASTNRGSPDPTHPNTASHRDVAFSSQRPENHAGGSSNPSVCANKSFHHIQSKPTCTTSSRLVNPQCHQLPTGRLCHFWPHEVNCLILLIDHSRTKTHLQGARGPLNAQLQILPLCTQQAHSWWHLHCHQHETAPCLVGDTLAPSQWILGLGAARHRSPNVNPR